MEDATTYITLFYFLFSFILIYPPTEIVTLGFTIQSIFASLLGSEQMFFVEYHVKRVLITICVHSFIPLGYFILLGLYVPDLDLFSIEQLSIYWKLYFSVSILLPISLLTLCYYWYMNNYDCNFIVKNLKSLATAENITWITLVNRINNEFRAIDKFSSGSMFNRVYVTNNWLLKVTLYNMYIISNNNINLHLTHANQVKLTQEGNQNQQFLNILVKPVITNSFKAFYICLNSFEYKDFKDKLLLPVEEAASVVIKQSLPDQFLDAFTDQINLNEKYPTRRENVDQCIGCMLKLADVKLVKKCDDLNSGECRQCNCKPMWCLQCMGKWFAYRQDQDQPQTWLSSRATCATCRATFCLLDVAPIEFLD